MQPQQKWRALLEPLLQGTVYELVGVECIRRGKHSVLRMYLDKPGGITIGEIATLTRKISVLLDVARPVAGPYLLEISSPGVERPLFDPLHFQRQIGENVSLRLKRLIDNRRYYRGLLLAADAEKIQIEMEGQAYVFNYADIDKAKLLEA